MKFLAATSTAALLLALAILWGCDSPPDVGAKGRAAARRLGEELAQAAPLVRPALAGGETAVAAALAEIFDRRARQGRPLACGLAVLDAQGVLIAARYPEKDKPRGVAESQIMDNYGNYQAVKTALQKDRLTKAVLHYPKWGRIPVVCCPLRSGGRMAGVLVLVVDPADAGLGGDLDNDLFLALDIPRPAEAG